MKTALYYFGTDIHRHGHYFWDISESSMKCLGLGEADITFDKIGFDPYGKDLPEKELHKGLVRINNTEKYTVLLIEGSPIDQRWGTKMCFFTPGKLSKEQMIELVKDNKKAIEIITHCPFKIDL